jgi:enamine deaminase RidA (YjgF/YER057c/UK114 family)
MNERSEASMKTTRRVTALLVLSAMALLGAGWWLGALHAQSDARSLKKDFINPTRGRFSGAVVVYGNGVKTIYVSGHTGRGEDLKAQALAAYQGVAKELAAAGATPEDVVKLNTYIANYKPEDRAAYDEAKRTVFRQDDMPASTMVGVQALVSPQNRIEVEAVAMIKE